MAPKPPTFLRGGVHPAQDYKYLTAHKAIERFVPAEVVIPLVQHLGRPAEPLVQRKAVVTRGQKIAEIPANPGADADSPDGAPIHASVSGVVKRVALSPHPTLVEAPAIVIETDPNAGEVTWTEVPDWRDLPKDEMIAAVRDAGIVGLGGAAFPTHRKLRLPPDIRIDTLIINGAECEPFLTSDHRLMVEHPGDILWGASLLAKILNARRVLIGVETNTPDAAAALRVNDIHLNNGIHAEVVLCAVRYPQGSERQLIEALTGRVVPPKKLPMHVGVMVQNVATAAACYHAIRYRMPLVDRVITVSGGGILQPRNLRVPLGTLVQDIAAACGGMHAATAKVIIGGPMMGRALGRLDVPIIKGTGGLLFLRTDEVRLEDYGPCISCGRCLSACPLGLEPNNISIYTEAGRSLETEEFGVKDCFECGCCSYVCPAERPLVQFIQMAKGSFRTGSQLGLAVRP